MARGRTRHTKAVVVDRTKLGESDLILTLLEADGTQGRAVAKGARKPGGKLAARVQLFCELDLLLAVGRSLDVVAEAQLLEPHAGLRGDLERVSAASVVCEVARLTCFEGASDPFLFPICLRALLACEQAGDQAHLDVVVAAYVLKVLSHQGWRPVIDSCVACGESSVTRFSALAGGGLCESCAREVAGAEPIDPVTLGWLEAQVCLTFDELLAAPVDTHTAALLLALVHTWAATHLDARLRAFEFALSV
ncbi:DNA repair protein RecO [uncultured Parolsenella sp.]|uniref:DNA repair protein RecO n=1 Tax=uncultured Parolsenella sp. TaxID=2083008 RepID=UPI0025F42760|nr:DNA repair protein RecO [uncultured Parolsenella sp.]